MTKSDTYNEVELDKKLLGLKGAKLDFPFGEQAAVYKVHGKMFAVIQVGVRPVRLSLKCDPVLAEVLRERYVTVLPGYHLNKKHWNTIVLTGQLTKVEVDDLISHSYQLVTETS